MSGNSTVPPSAGSSDELTRFQRLARALFGVDKKDVPKHEPTKRVKVPAQPPR